MWNVLELESTKSNIKFSIQENDQPISHARFLDLLSNSGSFRKFYNKILSDCNFEAFFWENKPVTTASLETQYECNLVISTFLAGVSPDAQTFRSYFKPGKQVVVFPNLGGDAQLIAPCPLQANSIYTHIGSFVREAPEEQIMTFWKQVGLETLKYVGSEPKWLSTSGLGVFWLHVRIDSYPKYYQTEAYKNVPG